MNAVKSGSLVAVPLPNGSCSVLWILEAGTYDAKGYFQFLIMEGFHSAVPEQEQLTALRVAEEPGGAFPGRDNVWKACLFGDLPNDFAVVGQRTLPRKDHPFFEAEGTMVFQDAEHCRAQLF